MVAKSDNLHGHEIQRSAVALLIVDVINDLEFPEGESLVQESLRMARQIADLRDRAEELGIPVIYVNDNFGRWRSDFQAQIQHCLKDDVRGKSLARLLEPGPQHYFVLKPRHSAFYSTSLEMLLRQLGVMTVIITGIAGNNCILFTAYDAYLRELKLIVPSDCVVSNTIEDNNQALHLMEQVLKADINDSTRLTSECLRQLMQQSPASTGG